ncbi:MAG: hypothetical protein GX096_00800 [Clostridiales bacterium]|nr:hypothetical protein [Clostridiales bacterium]
MKSSKFIALIAAFVMLFSMTTCLASNAQDDSTQIYLYGEEHSVETILDKELALWHDFYHNEGMRHLFVEYPYYTAEFLNLWMQSGSDGILQEIFADLEGTAVYSASVVAFYQSIKQDCPETIFHGTDVGHQYLSTGARYLDYLTTNQMQDSEQYALAQETVEQGQHYYSQGGDVYRESTMTANFIREFDKLDGERIMGIYGSAHTGLDAMDYATGSIPCMANQLNAHYGDIIYSENLAIPALLTQPERTDTLTLGGKEYTASYFGKADISWHPSFVYREFWRVENAYDDFKDCPKTGDVLPYDNYPMAVDQGQVFVIDYTAVDGSAMRMYYRCDGNQWDNQLSTEQFTTAN